MPILRLFPVMIAVLSLLACQQVARPVDDGEIAGIYYLVEVDGKAVPGIISHDGAMLEVRTGTFFISADGTCFSRTRSGVPGGEERTREVHARYVVKDSRMIMKWEGAGTTEGMVEGDNFTMDNHGIIFKYTRNP